MTGTVAVHLCFGYAALVHDKPSGYSFLPELENSKVQQVSIEAAQPGLDCRILQALPSKTIILGVIDLADMKVETPAIVASRIRRALDFVPAERLVVAPDCGMKYLPRPVAFAKMKAMAAGAALVRREIAGGRTERNKCLARIESSEIWAMFHLPLRSLSSDHARVTNGPARY